MIQTAPGCVERGDEFVERRRRPATPSPRPRRADGAGVDVVHHAVVTVTVAVAAPCWRPFGRVRSSRVASPTDCHVVPDQPPPCPRRTPPSPAPYPAPHPPLVRRQTVCGSIPLTRPNGTATQTGFAGRSDERFEAAGGAGGVEHVVQLGHLVHEVLLEPTSRRSRSSTSAQPAISSSRRVSSAVCARVSGALPAARRTPGSATASPTMLNVARSNTRWPSEPSGRSCGSTSAHRSEATRA